MKADPVIQRDVDEWKYVSLVTKEHTSHDFKFYKRSDTIDFIIHVSKACIAA